LKRTTIFLVCILFFLNCNNVNSDPREVLDRARLHVTNKEYAVALQDYKWFFENSTKIRSSLFGVKHSYCVSEWRNLGDLYEPALKLYRTVLNDRKNRLLRGEADWDLFMEFDALCKYDGRKSEVVEVFLSFHNDNQKTKFTKLIFNPIKEDLLSYGYTAICSQYIADPVLEAERIIELHRINMEREERFPIKGKDGSFSDEMYNKDVGFLLTVLKKSNRFDEFESVKNRLKSYYFTEKLNKLVRKLNKQNGA